MPLSSLYGATNEIPNDDALGAVFDRFLVRASSENLDSFHFHGLIARGLAGEREALVGRGDFAVGRRRAPLVSLADIRARKLRLSRLLDFPEEIFGPLQGPGVPDPVGGVTLSDRRVVKLLKLFAASALIDGRPTVDDGDFFILRQSGTASIRLRFAPTSWPRCSSGTAASTRRSGARPAARDLDSILAELGVIRGLLLGGEPLRTFSSSPSCAICRIFARRCRRSDRHCPGDGGEVDNFWKACSSPRSGTVEQRRARRRAPGVQRSTPPRVPRQRRAFRRWAVRSSWAATRRRRARWAACTTSTGAGPGADPWLSQLRRPHAPVDRARRDAGVHDPRATTVVDPFCGSGTALVEAMGLGRAASASTRARSGSPSRACARPCSATAAASAWSPEAARIAEESGDLARKRKRPDVPAGRARRSSASIAHVLFELLGLRELVWRCPPDDVGHALRLCLSSILVKFMKDGPSAPRDGAAKRIARGVPSRMLSDRAVELARGLAALEKRMPPGTPAPDVWRRATRAELPSRTLPRRWCCRHRRTPDLDYAELHDARFLWLGLAGRKFKSIQLGARSGEGGDTSATAWRNDQARWMREIARVLRRGGHALLVVGDGVLDGRAENASDNVAAAGDAAGLEPIARASQVRPVHERRLVMIFKATPRKEHLLLLRKR